VCDDVGETLLAFGCEDESCSVQRKRLINHRIINNCYHSPKISCSQDDEDELGLHFFLNRS
jgi:hypothetical protein